MADPAFVAMETEAEEFNNQVDLSRRRKPGHDKPRQDDDEPGDTTPLLGPTVLADQTDKRWYNTASV